MVWRQPVGWWTDGLAAGAREDCPALSGRIELGRRRGTGQW